jgi:DNA-binding transcriptional LysR family regulator
VAAGQEHRGEALELVRPPDLVEARVDVAFRLDAVPSSSYTTRRLGRSRRVICGSPEYLRRRGVPEHPDDLRDHD